MKIKKSNITNLDNTKIKIKKTAKKNNYLVMHVVYFETSSAEATDKFTIQARRSFL